MKMTILPFVTINACQINCHHAWKQSSLDPGIQCWEWDSNFDVCRIIGKAHIEIHKYRLKCIHFIIAHCLLKCIDQLWSICITNDNWSLLASKNTKLILTMSQELITVQNFLMTKIKIYNDILSILWTLVNYNLKMIACSIWYAVNFALTYIQ